LVEVTKRFGRLEAIDNATFDVRDGEYLCVLGPTGSGKTTLLRLIAGILRSDEGEIYIGDRNVNRISPEERNAVYVPQTYALFSHMTVIENVMFGPLARGVPPQSARDTAIMVLRMVRLDHRADSFPHELSGGMQQRVALARGLASGAHLLLLDEPLGALDARLRIELRMELRSLVKDSGMTAIHVTHDQEEAMMVADRILVLRNGRIQQHGTPFHVYNRPENIFVSSFVGGCNFLEGIVAHRNREGSTVRLRGNLSFRVADTSHELEEDVIVAFREEKTHIHTGNGNGASTGLSGEVTAVRFLGNFTRYEVRLVNGDLLAAKVPSSRPGSALKLEQRVKVSFDPRNTFVYDYPALGLKRELEAY
jgi:iron(III) transport system ATP-binding protein